MAWLSALSPLLRRSRSLNGGINLDLSDEQTDALAKELHNTVENDRYPFSPRIRTLREILHMLRPEPARERLAPIRHYEPPRERLAPIRHYEPPRATAKRRRRG